MQSNGKQARKSKQSKKAIVKHISQCVFMFNYVLLRIFLGGRQTNLEFRAYSRPGGEMQIEIACGFWLPPSP